MDCARIESEALIEKYLAGTLGQAEAEALEEHYFACTRCFEELELQRALQAELKDSAEDIRAEGASARPAWRWAWVAAPATAAVVLAAGLLLWRSAPQISPPVAVAPPPAHQPAAPEAEPEALPSQPESSLAELARVEPPVYIATVLRGPTDAAARRFHAGMKHYVSQDYAAAIPELRAASELDPAAPNINFFLAICYLLTDETDAAVSALEKTVALGESPFLEEAYFYLAKAYLHQGNLPSAEKALDNAVRLQGDREAKAQELLRQVRALRRKSE